MDKNKNNLFIVAATGLALFLTACGGNNGELPAEDNYQNTTESAPEATDNITGYGNIADTVSVDSTTQDNNNTSGTTSGTTAGSTTGASTAGTTGE